MNDQNPGPLNGFRVLDLTRVLAGPYCTMFLGDLGAEVLKVEEPRAGDDTRAWGPPFVGGESAYFLSINRNKKSLALDLKSEQGLELLRQLVEKADVLVENFSPGTMERLGLSEKDLRPINPKLIYASLSGYGSDGPMKDSPGYDLMIQAWGGLMSITGMPDGEPTKVGVAIVDIVAGLMLGKSILAALLFRERSGIGQKIETSLLEAEIACLVNTGSNYLLGGTVPSRWGNAHPNIVPYQNFKTLDGHLVIGVASDAIWLRFCKVIGMPELAEDSRFEKNPQRVEHREELISILVDRICKCDTTTWMRLLKEGQIPCAPVQTIDQVFNSPQVRQRKMLVEVQHPSAGKIPMVGLPVKLSKTASTIRLAPPILGQHSEEVLQNWLNLNTNSIDSLKSRGVIRSSDTPS